MGETPKKVLVFVLDEHGRTLTKESLHKLISELFDKVMDEQNIDAVVVNSHDLNACKYLLSQITNRDFSEWEIIYLHGSKYPPVLLAQSIKEKLVALLPEFDGTSTEAIYRILVDSGVFDNFH